MKKSKKIMILSILFVLVVSIGAASASDDINTTSDSGDAQLCASDDENSPLGGGKMLVF